MVDSPNKIPYSSQNLIALYGTFNIEMAPIVTIDVSDKISDYIKGDIIEIPNNISFSKLFGNVEVGKKKYLQITLNDRIINIAEDRYTDNIVIDLTDNTKRIKVIYSLYIDPNSNWRAIISGQLYQLKGYGILSEADLYIHITDCYNCVQEVKELINKITPSAIIYTSFKNQFEYPAIKLVHDLSIQHPDNSFLYFHTKGMSHNLHSRSLEEIILFTKTFESWRNNIQLLNRDGINKVGLFPSEEGWIWYNFWYAKGTYLASLNAPEITDHRWYYESWLGRGASNGAKKAGDCINIYKVKNVNRVFFDPVETIFYKANLMYRLFATKEFRKAYLIIKKPWLIYCYLQIRFFFERLTNKRKS